jgi:hypothetical protein
MSVMTDWKRISNKITKEEWLRRIEAIQDHRLKIKIASIVAWDYFSPFVGTPEWQIFQDYINEFSREILYKKPDIPTSLICQGLIQVGWPKSIAEIRSHHAQRYDTSKNTHEKNERGNLCLALMRGQSA